MDVAKSADRLAGYLAVQNTYLSTFQTLGGLGLVLGTIGLAAVMLRNVWERRRELALMRALGFSRSAVGWCVLAETALVLSVGLAIGTTAAALAVAPDLARGAGGCPVGLTRRDIGSGRFSHSDNQHPSFSVPQCVPRFFNPFAPNDSLVPALAPDARPQGNISVQTDALGSLIFKA